MRHPAAASRWLVAAGVLAAGLGVSGGAAAQNLAVADVQRIVSQAVGEALARGRPATIAVVDRVGNVLAVFQMTGAPARVTVSSARGIPRTNGLEQVQDTFAAALAAPNSPSGRLSAIAKAVTGAYLSSGGNAFTTRTASQIVQEHFNPGELFAPGGPLFGVQFSQLPCSDLSVRQATNAAVTGVVNATLGPKRSPLGLSADAGGLPLYKNNVLVGGIGVEADGVYTLDRVIENYDFDVDEAIAVAGQQGFEPAANIRAGRIFVDGRSLRYTDFRAPELAASVNNAPAFGTGGALADVTGYFVAAGGVLAGQTYGQAASGFAADPAGTFNFVGRTVFVLFNAAGNNRFPPTASTAPSVANGGLTANEVATILGNALKIAFAGRAQIRRPLNSHIQVTVSVVDANGNVLGIARTPDAPVFGTDVSLQKARSAAFMSNPGAADYLGTYSSTAAFAAEGVAVPAGQNANGVVIRTYLSSVRNVLGPSALASGVAFGARTIGNIARPFLPDGFEGAAEGPLSRPLGVWSPFNTGFQLDTVFDNIALHVRRADAVAGATDTDATCTFFTRFAGTNLTRLSNGLQIFAGGMPIFRGGFIIGGIGVSGDGIDQDDMVAFLGLNDGAGALGSGLNNAPAVGRADRLAPGGAHLRYVSCPFKPFINSRRQNVCDGK